MLHVSRTVSVYETRPEIEHYQEAFVVLIVDVGDADYKPIIMRSLS
jgi:hypothetical protein